MGRSVFLTSKTVYHVSRWGISEGGVFGECFKVEEESFKVVYCLVYTGGPDTFEFSSEGQLNENRQLISEK